MISMVTLIERYYHCKGKQQNMWLSTPGGEDYLKCHFGEHTESQESAWLPGSQALSSLPLYVSPKHGKWHFGRRKFLATFKASRQNTP